MIKNNLRDEHTVEAIAERLAGTNHHNYLGDFVLGAIDGAVTTFAVVSGVAGAGLSSGIAIVLGLANILADGFSMAVGNYLRAKSDHELVERARKTEERHIQEHPDGEREEIRQIFHAKGFDGDLLESIVGTITEDRSRWVDTMITEELGLQLQPPVPLTAALTTFMAFMLAGIIPLVPLFFANMLDERMTFMVSAAATALTFSLIGVIKGQITNKSILGSAAETVTIGGCAAALAYLVGAWLKGFVGV